ncbi:MAG: hypothetical protein HZA66_22780 [Rhodopseudomonas palustris]|uniref:Uncharacterized protein n=1 Tax=Rhodopseudomonas palustris TaxID=1076 RepID=A0A933VXP5_RHOPL|nr:hypothetical protein [Rhodopseudomonas palustris]
MAARSLAILTAIGVATLAAAAQAQTAANWQRYVIPDTGAAADVPAAIFDGESTPAQYGVGRRFVTADGRADLSVQTIPNERGLTPAGFLAAQNPPSGIIYRRVTPRFFVVSSVRDGRIWYNRCNRATGAMNCVLMNYPAGEKRKWDAIVTRISHSLR